MTSQFTHNMNTVKIGDFLIDNWNEPFIVAEAGINHNGNLKNALEMIKIAKNAGVNAIKFQTFKAEEFVSNKEQLFTYTSQGKEISEPMYDLFKRCELVDDDWYKIKEECDKEGVIFFSTAQNPSDLKLLIKLGVPAIKVGSDDLTNLPLLKKYSQSNLPIIISCGMSTFEEIDNALNTIGSIVGYPTVLLITTSQYPTPPEDVNLRRFETLRKKFPLLPMGYSDHTMGSLASTLALSFGACFFEKHFTIDHNLDGPDHWFSANPSELKEWVESIRRAYTLIGDSTITPTKHEQGMRKLARRSIVAIKDISQGEVLDESNLGLKRPGIGLPPKFLEQILGLHATGNISKESLIKNGDFQ